MGKAAASGYIVGFSSSGLTMAQALEQSDIELAGALSLKKQTVNERYQKLAGQFVHFEKELKRTGVTLQLLWTEYIARTPDGYEYSPFCHYYNYEPSTRICFQHRRGCIIILFQRLKQNDTGP
jgi:hypothetical protein